MPEYFIPSSSCSRQSCGDRQIWLTNISVEQDRRGQAALQCSLSAAVGSSESAMALEIQPGPGPSRCAPTIFANREAPWGGSCPARLSASSAFTCDDPAYLFEHQMQEVDPAEVSTPSPFIRRFPALSSQAGSPSTPQTSAADRSAQQLSPLGRTSSGSSSLLERTPLRGPAGPTRPLGIQLCSSLLLISLLPPAKLCLQSDEQSLHCGILWWSTSAKRRARAVSGEAL